MSHRSSLAEHFGRQVRSQIAAHGKRLNVFLRQDSRAAGRFSTEAGGEYFATGVQGTVTGRRADLAIIDDPIASFEEARSKTCREGLWNWYRSELVTRLKPGGRIVLATTRWHQDDIAGRLMAQPGWRVLRLPALAEAGDPLGRGEGEALWPEWESEAGLLAKKAAIGESAFAALFQQAPLDPSGTIFDVSKLDFVDRPVQGRSVRAWDFASGTQIDRNPDWTVGMLVTKGTDGHYYIDDVRRLRLTSTELIPFVLDTAARDGAQVTVSVPRDPGQAGVFQADQVIKSLAGYKIHASREVGSKTGRASFWAGPIEGGIVHIRRGSWNTVFLEELALFPNGPKDDQVDALSRALTALEEQQSPARFADFSITQR